MAKPGCRWISLTPMRWADQVIDVPANPGACAHLGPAARAHVVGTYDFRTLCLPEHIRQMNALVPENLRIAVPG